MCDNKGQVAGLDAAIAFLGLLCGLFLLLSFVFSQTNSSLDWFKRFELERSAVFLTDSLIKNNDPNFSQYGSAALDFSKKRVLSNELDAGLLSQVPFGQSQEPTGVFFNKVLVRFFGGETQTVLDGGPKPDCAGVRRVVRVSGQKAVLETEVCRG